MSIGRQRDQHERHAQDQTVDYLDRAQGQVPLPHRQSHAKHDAGKTYPGLRLPNPGTPPPKPVRPKRKGPPLSREHMMLLALLRLLLRRH